MVVQFTLVIKLDAITLDIWANAFTFGVTRPAPLGVQKFTWNTKTRSFEKNWINNEIDNTDVMVPVISAASRMIYLAHKQNGVYEYGVVTTLLSQKAM